jgi:DHA1 family inner membrane transport protein
VTSTTQSAPPISSGRIRFMLAVLCWTSFLITGTSVSTSPFLLDMARDLNVELFYVANLVSFVSITWGTSSLFSGAASDRIGRRPIMVAGVLLLGTGLLGVSTARDFPWAVGWQMLGGFGGGAFMGTVFAAVSDRVPTEIRGRALGFVMTGQSLSLVLGVPLVTFLGSFLGWRGAIASQASALVLSSVLVWLCLPRINEQPRGGAKQTSVFRELKPRLFMILTAAVSERICFGVVAVYLATFFITTYGVGLDLLAIVLALVCAGNLVGNVLGGQLADRAPSKLVSFAVSSLATGVLALPLLVVETGMWAATAIGFCYALANGSARPAILARLSEVPSHVRGTVLGMNVTFASIGWITSAGLGGVLVTTVGFWALGIFALSVSLVGAAIALAAAALDSRDRRSASPEPAIAIRPAG